MQGKGQGKVQGRVQGKAEGEVQGKVQGKVGSLTAMQMFGRARRIQGSVIEENEEERLQ